MFHGVATISFFADDHAAAVDWYRRVFAMDPYFERPGYAEWRVGALQQEIGIIDAAFAPPGHRTGAGDVGGAIVLWAVDDVPAAVARLLKLGATLHDEIRQRGEGFVTATVADPFGNLFGVMTNPHFAAIVQRVSEAT